MFSGGLHKTIGVSQSKKSWESLVYFYANMVCMVYIMYVVYGMYVVFGAHVYSDV